MDGTPMAGMYILLAAYVLAKNFGELPQVFALIFQNAFGLNEAVGGGVGAAMMLGIKGASFQTKPAWEVPRMPRPLQM